MQRARPGECALFEGEIGVQVDLGGINLLVTEPERRPTRQTAGEVASRAV
jgi:hypothetical protein